MSAGGQRDVESIVDENACAGAVNGSNTTRDEPRDIPRLHVAFANLDEIDTGRRGGRDALHERIFPAGQATAVSDHADDRTHAILRARPG